ncbi:hypothetical protein LINGRAHAP2_LOCUS4250 [Linum grandiflorum]
MVTLTERVNANDGGRNRGRRDEQHRQQRRDVPVYADSDSSSEEEIPEADQDGENQQNRNDYRVKADILLFYGTMGADEFLDWQIDVDRFFEVMEVPKNKQVKMVAIQLKNTTAVWWDKLVVQRQGQRKAPIRTWRRMKQLLLDCFLPADYEQILYNMYIDCVQGRKSVTEYTAEFLRFSNGLKGSIQEKMGLQTVWTVTEASTLALKPELIEKSPKNFSSFRRFPL